MSINQRRKRNGTWAHSDHPRRPRQPKRTREQEAAYAGECAVKAAMDGRAFTAKILARDAATLGYKVIGRGL